MKTSLKATGIMNLIISFPYFLFSFIGGFLSLSAFIYLVVTGIIFLNYSSEEDLTSKRNTILILSIILIPINFIAAVINLCNIKLIKKVDIRGPTIDPETKRLDLLIKFGLVLIGLSGLLLIINNINKVSGLLFLIILTILSMVFFGLYKLFSTKIKLNTSRKLYYILFNFCLVLIYLTIGYYSLFGEFSMNGTLYSLYYFGLHLLLSMLVYYLKNIVKSDITNYASLIFITYAIFNLLLFIKFNAVQACIIIELLSIFIYIKFNNKYLKDYSLLLNYIMLLINLFYLMVYNFSISLCILTLINVVLIVYLTIKYKKLNYINSVILPLIVYIYPFILSIKFCKDSNIELDNFIIIYMLYFSFVLIVNKLFKPFYNNKVCSLVEGITSNVLLFIINLIALFDNNFILLLLLISRLCFLVAYYTFDYKYKIKSVDYYVLPFNIVMILLSLFIYLTNFIDISFGFILLFILLFMSLYYLFSKNKVLDLIIIIILLLLNCINIFNTFFIDNSLLLLFVLLSTSIMFIIFTLKDNKAFIKTGFIFCLIGSFLVLSNSNIDYILSFILNIILYLVLLLITINDKKYYKYVLLFMCLPIFKLLSTININEDIILVLQNSLLYYLLAVILHLFINNKSLKLTLFNVFSVLLLIDFIFSNGIIIATYTLIIIVLLIIVGIIKTNCRSTFWIGIVLLIIEVLYHLRSVLASIPIWLYLLIIGLSIIVYATIKEFKRNNK